MLRWHWLVDALRSKRSMIEVQLSVHRPISDLEDGVKHINTTIESAAAQARQANLQALEAALQAARDPALLTQGEARTRQDEAKQRAARLNDAADALTFASCRRSA